LGSVSRSVVIELVDGNGVELHVGGDREGLFIVSCDDRGKKTLNILCLGRVTR
jgi:hypothetical protein